MFSPNPPFHVINGSDLSEQEIVLLPKVVGGAQSLKKPRILQFSVCSEYVHLYIHLSVTWFWLYVSPVHVSQLELTTSAGSPSLQNPIQNDD